jgi:hypothetical protein
VAARLCAEVNDVPACLAVERRTRSWDWGRSVRVAIYLDDHRERLCCVDRCDRSASPAVSSGRRSESLRQVDERGADPVLDWQVEGELVVAAAQVLQERMPAAMTCSELMVFIPRIGRSRALSRP